MQVDSRGRGSALNLQTDCSNNGWLDPQGSWPTFVSSATRTHSDGVVLYRLSIWWSPSAAYESAHGWYSEGGGGGGSGGWTEGWRMKWCGWMNLGPGCTPWHSWNITKDVNSSQLSCRRNQLDFDQLCMPSEIMQVEFALCIIQSSNFQVKYMLSGLTSEEELCEATAREGKRDEGPLCVSTLNTTILCVCVCVCVCSNMYARVWSVIIECDDKLSCFSPHQEKRCLLLHLYEYITWGGSKRWIHARGRREAEGEMRGRMRTRGRQRVRLSTEMSRVETGLVASHTY